MSIQELLDVHFIDLFDVVNPSLALNEDEEKKMQQMTDEQILDQLLESKSP